MGYRTDNFGRGQALDRNLDSLKPALKAYGATESQIEAARAKMHRLNSEQGLYK